MNKKSVITVTALVVVLTLGLAGCDDQPAPSTQEIASPTGCFKSKGRYFDPKTHQCVQVTDKHQALVLNTYRYVNKLVEDGNLTEVEYDISLKTYVTIDKAETLWFELRDQGATMTVLSGVLPDNREYDPLPGKESEGLHQYIGTPKVWGGDGVSAGCGWMKRDDAPADTIQGMILEGIKTVEADTFLGPARARPELRKAVLEDNECRISSMVVHANPKVMLDWWNRHLDDVEGIQPQVNFLDTALPSLGPVQPLKEGN